jgi:NhaP-type Na+/H+ and K+/H+ antiporter
LAGRSTSGSSARGIWYDGLLLALLLVLLARPVVVLPLLAPLRMRWGERLFIAWAGMKGAAPILLTALAAVGGFESERMYGIVFIVVLFSVVVQGGTVRQVADRLALRPPACAADTTRASGEAALLGVERIESGRLRCPRSSDRPMRLGRPDRPRRSAAQTARARRD